VYLRLRWTPGSADRPQILVRRLPGIDPRLRGLPWSCAFCGQPTTPRSWPNGMGAKVRLDPLYLSLWHAAGLVGRNLDYEVAEFAPGIVLFGSNGGGEGFRVRHPRVATRDRHGSVRWLRSVDRSGNDVARTTRTAA
jgi:hypothetical protein